MFSAEGYSAPGDPLIGQIVQERYQIMHAIGKGAMGVVYEAQHLLIGRKVALKTMAAQAVSPAGVERFRREAKAAAAVGNSHVVDVLDMGRLEDGSLYIVMERLDGVDLGFAVALEQRFSVGRTVHVMTQLCDALSAIHAAGIVHRDLKPENIFLTTRDGAPDFVKVLDFGVCKVNDPEGSRLTATGDTLGTPLFMAPEQVEGRSDCDHRVDIYALGAILHYVLTGRAPFDAPNLPALLLRICHEPPPSLASTESYLSFELDAIVQRALSKDRNARFDSCAAFKAALRALQTTPDEIAATLPGAADAARMTEYAWGNVGGGGSLIRTQPLRRMRAGVGALGVLGVGLGALAVSIASGPRLVRSLSAQTSAESASVSPASSHESKSASSASPPLPTIAVTDWPGVSAEPTVAKVQASKSRTPAAPHRVPPLPPAASAPSASSVSAEPATASELPLLQGGTGPAASASASSLSSAAALPPKTLPLTKGVKGGL
jgi:serine/threonine-protein kinase